MNFDEVKAQPLWPLYIIDAYYVDGAPTVNGNLTDAVWSAPGVTVTHTTNITSGWNLTIYTFVNLTHLFVGVDVQGDTSRNPNDYCQLCFDVDHNNTGLPDTTDLKIRAENTALVPDEYYLYNGSGAGWTKYSDHTNVPNPWPSGYLASGNMTDWNMTGEGNMTYEFQVPISAAWGQDFPPDGNITGFCVHAFGQADNEHVWWPDNFDSGVVPSIEYCDNASYYGDLIYHGSGNIPDHLEYVSGDDQTGTVATTLAQPLQMRVLNDTGGSVPNILVNYSVFNWSVGATGYYFVESGLPWFNSYSDVLGVANATLHLGSRPGNYQVNASNSGLTGNAGPTYINTLNATATIGPLASIEVIASPDAVDPGSSSALTIWANDSQGNSIAGLVVDVVFKENPSAPGASVSTPATDNADGTYSSSYTAGSTGGVIDIVNASSGGFNGTVNITVNASTLASLVIAANPTSVPVAGTSTITIWANDTGGFGIPGLTIDMSLDANPSAPGVSVTTPATDAGGGVYTATYTAGQTAGVTDTVNATTGGMSATVDIDVLPGAANDLVYVSGNGQSKDVDLDLDDPFIVRVVDQFGNNVSGAQVDWVVDGIPTGAAGQGLSPATNNTDASGLTGSTLTLGDLGGMYYANATSPAVVGDSVDFSALATLPFVPMTYHIFIDGGDDQTGSTGSTLASSLVVSVKDQSDNDAPGIGVWFNVTSGGGSVDATNPVITDVNGLARTNLTLGPNPGLNTVTAEISSDGTNRVTFNATGTEPTIAVTLASNVTSVVAGHQFAYILSYDNIGSETASNVLVNMTFPSSSVYVSDSSVVIPVISGSHYSWSFSSVSVGAHSFTVVCSVPVDVAAASISNHFTVDYIDQAGDRKTQEISNTITIDILDEPVTNVPPIIQGVPDLIVHYDWDYAIDLSPYITDPDTISSALFLILSDTLNARVDTTNNLVIILNYSQSFVGSTLTLNITVSDGLGSDWDSILVSVTDDFPPEILQNLPDVTLNEDQTAYAFNITQYFFDRDGDSLYYTLGEKMINITILWNFTVRIIPEADWFGEELITFRALDPSGALIEDTIKITVLAVNDPPILLSIPDQDGIVNIAWVLDLSAYISDVDNSQEELTITSDAEYVTVNGLNLTFRVSEPMEGDIITVTVSDGDAQTFGQVNIVVTPATAGSGLPLWIFPPLIILLAALLLLFLVAKRRKLIIEQAYLIFHDGTLMSHVTNRMIPEMDSEIFSSMFIAIQDFIKDSFKDEKKWELKKLEFGDSKIFIERGQSGWTVLALVYKDGRDSQLEKVACETLNAVEKEYYTVLDGWDGNLDKVRGSRDLLAKHLFKN